MAWTFCTSEACIAAAGANANSDIVASVARLSQMSTDAEGFIELETGKSFLDSYSTLPTGIKYALANVCKRLIATEIVAYDTSGYSWRDADSILNTHDEIFTKGLTKLKDYKYLKLSTP